MRRGSRAVGWVVLGLLVTVLVEACASSEERDGPRGGISFGGTSGLGNMDATTVDAPTEGGAAGMARPDYDPLCGIAMDGCVPDDRQACADYRAGAGGQSTGGTGTGGGGGRLSVGGSSGSTGNAGETAGAGEAGGSGMGGEGGQGSGGEGTGTGQGGQSTAGTSGSGGSSGTSGSSGNGGSSGTLQIPEAGPITYSCQVHATLGEAASACLPAGMQEVDEPCLGGADCRAGLACVGKVAGRCRPYCCDHAACRAGTHCSAEPLVGLVVPAGEDLPSVPVCVPAIPCNLAEDYPCADGGVCTCTEGTACMVVASDGSTSCVPPGEGTEGDACPCAWGFVCSEGANQCSKLCQTAAPAEACGTGRCQTSPALPLGWGICVGTALPDAG